MILQIQQGSRDEGLTIPRTTLCRWSGFPRRMFYDKPIKAKPAVQERLANSIKQILELESSFGCRAAGGLLGFNKNTVQLVFHLIV
jgi:putative transposase